MSEKKAINFIINQMLFWQCHPLMDQFLSGLQKSCLELKMPNAQKSLKLNTIVIKFRYRPSHSHYFIETKHL